MDKPIAIFDSGIGGLTVAKGIHEYFPNEKIIYFGDTAHLPYGEKSTEAIREYSLEIAEFLLQYDCKMIIIACNTASAAAKDLLEETFGKYCPIIDVISPLVKKVAQLDYQKIGVIATRSTTRSNIYSTKIQALRPDIEISSLATALLASMIEENFCDDNISEAIIHKYLSYPDFENIQALLLACTHYPLIKKEINAFFKGKVELLDSIQPVIDEVESYLEKNNLFRANKESPKNLFFVSDYTESFEQTAKIFYQKDVSLEVAKWNKHGKLSLPEKNQPFDEQVKLLHL